MSNSDAEYYQDHRDDREEWGEPEPTPPTVGGRRLDAVVSVRVSAEEEALLRAAATEHGMSLSAFVRSAALSTAGQRRGMAPAELATTLETLARRVREASLG